MMVLGRLLRTAKLEENLLEASLSCKRKKKRMLY